MINKYVLFALAICTILYVLILKGHLQYETLSIFVPIILFVSVFFFDVKKHGFLITLNSLCISFVLYGIMFKLVELAGITVGWEAYTAIMIALFLLITTVIANFIWWIRKDKKSH
jgi:hypothetical protein